jgi:hypothetical protein
MIFSSIHFGNSLYAGDLHIAAALKQTSTFHEINSSFGMHWAYNTI